MQTVSTGDNLHEMSKPIFWKNCLFVCVEVLQPSQPNGVMSSAVSLPKAKYKIKYKILRQFFFSKKVDACMWLFICTFIFRLGTFLDI